MRSSGFFSSSTTTYLYFADGVPLPPRPSRTVIPIDSPSAAAAAAAVRIQSVYRGHLVRALVGRVRRAEAEAARFQRLIQRQDTVDAVRCDERERLRVAEGLMALLLGLDAVPGFYPAVRELRRAASRRVVALQELLDAIVGERVEGADEFPASWEELLWRAGGGGDGKGEAPLEAEEERMTRRGLRCLEGFLLGGGPA